ncbi:MAG: DNA mismatch repair protein MutS [Nanobdellota archaeon]
MGNITPAMKQYMKVKKDNPDCLVLFRMGDFYETFYDDAKKAAEILDITLTARGRGENKAPLAGIPYHSLNSHLSKLLKNDVKVAIVEQTEDPKKAKKVVKRDLIRIITPGTIVEEDFLESSENNYLVSLSRGEKIGLSYVDISTGEFRATLIENEQKLQDELLKLKPSEIILPSNDGKEGLEKFYTTERPVHEFFYDNAREKLEERFPAELDKKITESAGALLYYLEETQKKTLDYIEKPREYDLSGYMKIDPSTEKNLELTRNIIDNTRKSTLLSVLDRTKTSGGKRELKKRIQRPLISEKEIRKRLDAVEEMKEDALFRSELRDTLSYMHDIERLISKVSFGNANPKDLVALRQSLGCVPSIKDMLKDTSLNELEFPDVSDTYSLLEKAVKDEPNTTVREGNIIREGYNDELDELHKIRKDGKKYIADIEKKEIERTGIRSLKVRYNKVFGYFIEVTKANLNFVPEDYIRKQTQVNSERFITDELKKLEEKIVTAEEKINELEFNLFSELLEKIAEKAKDIQTIAKSLAKTDVTASLAETAFRNNYIKPAVSEVFDTEIREGRHPVIEEFQEEFIANDCAFSKENKLMIITGPNMAGKSTYMRQNALIILMAQMGCFVPAKKAEIGIVDRIFSRVGAYDDLTHGQSTFMVEMTETANILRNATERSFIILDEIGRGTSTFDGVAIAWSVAEEIQNIGAKAMFATHYHVLNRMEEKYTKIKNYNIAVMEKDNRIIFLRKIKEGATDKSYGIHVAELAGVPKKVIERAEEIQADLEKEDKMEQKIKPKKPKQSSLEWFG